MPDICIYENEAKGKGEIQGLIKTITDYRAPWVLPRKTERWGLKVRDKSATSSFLSRCETQGYFQTPL